MKFVPKFFNFHLIVIIVLSNYNLLIGQEFKLEYLGEENFEKTFTFDSYKDLILNIEDSLYNLNEKGYINSKVEYFYKIDSLNYKVQIEKNEKIEFIKIRNILDLDQDLISIINNYSVNNLIKFDSKDTLLKKILESCSEKGYPFAKIKYGNFEKINPKVLESSVIIDKGPKKSIDKIVVKGLDKFPKNILNNIFKPNKRKVLDVEEINKKVKLIENYNFSKSVRDPELLFTNDSTTLYLYMKKTKRNAFDGFIGFDSDEDNGKINIQGYAKIILLNTFNQGENLMFDFISENNEDRSLRSDLYLPYVLGFPVSLRTNLHIVKKDSTYNSTESLAEFDLSFGNFKFGLGFQSINSNVNSSFENFEGFSSNLINIFSSYEKNNFNDMLITNEMRILLKYGFGRKTQINQITEVNKYLIEIQKKFNLNSRFKILMKLTNEKLNSKNLVFNEMIRFGGANSLRGFYENSIFADSYLLINSDLNFYMSKSFNLYTIFDIAQYENRIDDVKDNLYSLGLGLSYLTENGLVSINYCKGDEWGNEFSLKNAKISVKFVTFF